MTDADFTDTTGRLASLALVNALVAGDEHALQALMPDDVEDARLILAGCVRLCATLVQSMAAMSDGTNAEVVQILRDRILRDGGAA